MDSITQAALGAAVAEAGMGGRRLGNKAILWGIALGTLPDLDIVAYPWLDQIQRLEWHRGWSHSLVIMALVSPLIGWLIARLHHGRISFTRASWTVFAVLATHSLIDVFTVYGTMVFAPLSDYRAGWNNMFIIDPLFTLPMLIGTGITMFCRLDSRLRTQANAIGLALATLYAAWSLGAKSIAESRMHHALAAANISHRRLATSPTPFNTLLWRGLAERDHDFVVTYHSLLNPKATPEFEFIAKNHEALGDIADSHAATRLAWFANGFHNVEKTEDGWLVSDWRFGEWRAPDGSDKPVSVFSWLLQKDGDSIKTIPLRTRSDIAAHLRLMAKRLLPQEE